MKYKEEYFLTANREEFVNLILKKYTMMEKSAKRRWYDLKHRYGKQNYFGGFDENEMEEPSSIKLLQLADMRRMGYKFHKKMLQRYGYNWKEINWIETELRKNNEKYGEE